jgi:V/A-type H+/Na+-transporting ATPase subunit K
MLVIIGKAIGAALAIGLAAIGTGYAQGKIGAAGAGAIAEKPETFGRIMILEALPEVLAVLGFVVAAMIITQLK